MAGNKHPWRDIYSNKAWTKVLELTQSDSTREVVINGRNLLEELGKQITAYNLLSKPDRTQFVPRIINLGLVEAAAALYLTTKNSGYKKSPDKNKGEERYSKGKMHPRNPATFVSPVATESSIDPWVYSLARRAAKKAAYLACLQQRLPTDLASVKAFVTYLTTLAQTPRTGSDLLPLVPGVSVEGLDPAHRAVEVVVEGSDVRKPKASGLAMNDAFIAWYRSNSDRNFLEWLEDHPICTFTPYLDDWQLEQGAKPWLTSGIQYTIDAEVWQVFLSGTQLLARSALSQGVTKPLKTRDGQGTKKGEAFAWLATGELLVHPHASNAFHHSSLSGGAKVRCAGNIIAEDGKATWVDNNSGHYHPTDLHFLTFIGILVQRDAFSANARVQTLESEKDKLPATGLEIHLGMSVAEYQSWAQKKGLTGFNVGVGGMTRPFYL